MIRRVVWNAFSRKMTESWDVVVVGSCMIDLICYAPRLPKSGETLCGTHFMTGFGGKGCNQCVASKKLGAKSLLVARIGNDFYGKNYYNKLEEYKLPTRYVKMTEGVSTGVAQITVSGTGENHIIIIPGANNNLSEDDVEEAVNAIINCKVLVCQMEVSESSTIKALKIKANCGIGKSIFNAAPAKADLNPLLFVLPDIFCVNESEAEIITGMHVSGPETAKSAIQYLFSKGCKEVIITLGEKGAVYENINNAFEYVPALPVKAVDTTGAGDAFLGGLAFYLAKYPEKSIKEIIKQSNNIAAYSVQKHGTQESFPAFSELNLTN